MRSLICCLLSVLAPVIVAEPRLDWMDSRGDLRWSLRLTSSAAHEEEALLADEWFPPLPRIALPRIVDSSEAESLSLDSFRGRVVILDFWASWCAPCLEALPSLQRLVATHSDRGLAALAINVDEEDGTALRFANALGLELPLLRLTPGTDELFDIKRLPTTVVVDREGRMRARFNGSHPELEARLAAVVERLLDGAEVPRHRLAGVRRGHADVAWSKELNGNAQAVAPMPEGAAVGRALLGVVGWDVVGLDADGRLHVNKRAGSGYESLLVSPADDRGGVGIHIYRRFGKRLARIEFGPDSVLPIEFDDHLLDVRPDDGAGRLWLGTTEGLIRVDSRGVVDLRSRALGAVWGIGGAGGGSRPVLTVADEPSVQWLDAQLNPVNSTPAFAEARRLLATEGAAGFGLASAEVVAWALGSFFDGDRVQLAIASGERLHLIDVERGSIEFEAEWPEIRGLSAYDPASTGRSMLAVASGKRITTLLLSE